MSRPNPVLLLAALSVGGVLSALGACGPDPAIADEVDAGRRRDASMRADAQEWEPPDADDWIPPDASTRPADAGTFRDAGVSADAAIVDAGVRPDAGAAPDGGAQVVRVATYNVHQFFDTICHSGRCGPTDFEEQLTAAQLSARADEIATAIGTLDATVVLLEEVENQYTLTQLANRLPRYPVNVIGETWLSGGTLDVAVLAEGRLLEKREHRALTLSGSTQKFARVFLEVHLEIASRRVIVFAAHFKSQRDDDAALRLAEAREAAAIIAASAAEFPDALIVLGGDLNDSPGTPPIQALEVPGELLRVASELSDYDAATYVWDGVRTPLDHLFVSLRAKGAYVPGSVRIARGTPWGLGGSDHAAVVAGFRLPQ